MTNKIEATETTTHEVVDLLPEEVQDFLAEQALKELKEAILVPFTPVEDAKKLDRVIEATERKLKMLLELDVAQIMKQDLEGFAQLQKDDDTTEDIALINRVHPPLQEILQAENAISASISRYQKILSDCLKQRRLLSGQMFGTRMAHSAQVSRMKRVRQIQVTGNDLLKELGTGVNQEINPKQELQRIEHQESKSKNIVELFSEEPIDAMFEPLTDTLPFEQVAKKVYPENKQDKIQKEPTKKDNGDERYCSSYED